VSSTSAAAGKAAASARAEAASAVRKTDMG
jgi:hypothetical protein